MGNDYGQFWTWFSENLLVIEALYTERKLAQLSNLIGQNLDKIDPRLAWEIGPGKQKQYLLTISGEGDVEMGDLAEQIIRAAPDVQSWEFYSARPARPGAARIRLPNRNLEFDTKGWMFSPIERADAGRLDLLIYDDALALSAPDDAVRAVWIYLGEILGDEDAERWIGEVNIGTAQVEQHDRIYGIAEIADYLYWATHRPDEPLRQAD
jgi:hypothetical protein